MPSQQPLPPKKEVALALLERSSVHLHLDPRVDGVIVPSWFKKQPQLVLQIGLNMPVPIPDLRLDDEGMSCTLSFNRAPFHCSVPWTSVFAMVGDDMRGMVWPDDMPPEVAQQSSAKAPAAVEPALKQATPPRAKPTLREVPPPPAATAKPKRSRKKATPAATTTPKASRAPVGVVPPARSSSPAVTPVPAASRAPARQPPRALPAPAPAADADDSTPRAPRAPQSPPRKPKRELPPYLRVVK